MPGTDVASPPEGPDKADEKRYVRRPWATNLGWAASIAAAAAVVLVLILDISARAYSSSAPWTDYYLSISFPADIVVIWLILATLIALTNRTILSVGGFSALIVLVAVANRIKLDRRFEPIFPSDIDFVTEPGFLSAMVSPATILAIVFCLVTLILGAVLASRRWERRLLPFWPTQYDVKARMIALAARALVVIVTVGLLSSAARFSEPGNGWRKLYELGTVEWQPWYQKANYAAHGFVSGFLYNLPTNAMPVPEGYGPERMAEIAAKYQGVADRINTTRTASLDDTNVIFVLSESFSDPTRLNGVELSEDPIPRTRELMSSTTSGTMSALQYGGGTANVEFEVLTGQSTKLFAPQLSSPYQMLVSDYDEYPSAVGWFGSQGHRAIAIHPYITGLYKRRSVYQTFGFEDFIHDTTMAERELIDDGEFISDTSAYDEVELQIRKSDEPLMVNLVTMQNHGPYDDVYRDPIGVTGVSDSVRDRVGMYARGLAHADDALAKFLADLKKSDEKTVVVFYGDHLPGIYDAAVEKDNPDHELYETPFLIWSSQGTPARTLPVTGPMHFLPLLYEAVDAPVPPYFAMLERLRGEISALEGDRAITPEGETVAIEDLSPEAQDLLEEVRLVQYDFSIGDRYALDRMWPGATG